RLATALRDPPVEPGLTPGVLSPMLLQPWLVLDEGRARDAAFLARRYRGHGTTRRAHRHHAAGATVRTAHRQAHRHVARGLPDRHVVAGKVDCFAGSDRHFAEIRRARGRNKYELRTIGRPGRVYRAARLVRELHRLSTLGRHDPHLRQ